MRNRIRQCAAGVAIATLLVTGSVAMAQGPDAGGRRGGRAGGPAGFGRIGGPGLGLPLRELNLTEAQQQQVKGIEQQHRAAAQQIAERLRTAMDAQRTAIEADPVNDGLIRSTTQQLADVQADAAIERAHLRSDILAILTPDQQAQVKKLEGDRQSREHQRRNKQ